MGYVYDPYKIRVCRICGAEVPFPLWLAHKRSHRRVNLGDMPQTNVLRKMAHKR